MKKLNNNGFTVVELMISFSLTMVIVILLFQIVMALKDVYASSGVKTEVLVRNSNIVHSIQMDIHNKKVVSLISCGSDCYQFGFADGSSKQLFSDVLSGVVSYGNYRIELANGSVMNSMQANIYRDDSVEEGVNDTIISIVIPIKNRLFPVENHDISVIFQVDSRTSFVTDLEY